jgi:hypothetical protein
LQELPRLPGAGVAITENKFEEIAGVLGLSLELFFAALVEYSNMLRLLNPKATIALRETQRRIDTDHFPLCPLLFCKRLPWLATSL